MTGAWLREEQADLATDKILEAAAVAFVELGVSRTGMGDIAKYAGCSRGTLYRYFTSRNELLVAYVNRSAAELSARVAAEIVDYDDPEERLIEGILRSVREVRATPGTAAWFEPGESGGAARVSHSSEVIDAVTGTFVATLLAPSASGGSNRLEARWLVRVIVSLLTMPGESEEEERELITRFVAPGLLEENSR
jgi:AcrR family transcriptional regulator